MRQHWRKITPPTGHGPCTGYPSGVNMLRDLIIVSFSIAAGFTASGIVANLYKLFCAVKPTSLAGRTAYFTVMVVAGPNVIFAKAATAVRGKEGSKLAFWLTTAVASYWSFAIGLFVLNVALAL
jgi:hypothetical protein